MGSRDGRVQLSFERADDLGLHFRDEGEEIGSRRRFEVLAEELDETVLVRDAEPIGCQFEEFASPFLP
jgi:hypothetical protein